MKRAVVFDIGGVLLTLGSKQYMQAVSDALQTDSIKQLYAGNAHRLDRGEITETELWRQVSDVKLSDDAFDAVFARHFRPIEPMLNYAAQLRQRGIATAILSNTIPSHVRVMRGMGFMDDFDPVALSCELSLRKPDPAAINFVLQQLGLPPEAVAYVDDIAENVEMGAAAGVYSILHDGDVNKTIALLEAWVGSK